MNEQNESNEKNQADSALISIVVPVYKVEDLLARCIDSILGQSYAHFELILVDDGSPDNCGQLCDEYAKRDSRIKVIHKKNGGISDARNSGIEASEGHYIAFIDSDDWIHPEYLNHLYNNLIEQGADISCCGLIKTFGETPRIEGVNAELSLLSNEEAIGLHFTPKHAQIVVAWAKLYDIELFKDVRYPKNKLHEDEYTTYKLLYSAQKIVLSNLPYYYYFQRADSIVGTGFRIEKRLAAIEAYTQRADFLSQAGFSELASITYREIFLISFNIFPHLESDGNQDAVAQFKKNFETLRSKLRKHPYPLKFRAFYELHFKFPKLIRSLHAMLTK